MQKHTTLKPIAPKEYDGSVDLRAFHWFIIEGTTYVEDGNVPQNWQVFVLSYYLKGKSPQLLCQASVRQAREMEIERILH